MDFSLTPDQEELRGLVARVLSDRCTMERLKEVESGSGVDLDLWRELADLGIVGIALPEADGGAGLGWTEIAIVLEEVGRHVAPVPALPVMAMAGPFLAEHAPQHLAGLASGERIVTVALHDLVGDVHSPSLTATGGALDGVKTNVQFGTVADAFIVSATDGLYYIEASAPGVTVERQDTTDSIPDAKVTFSGAKAERIAGPEALDRLIQSGWTGQSLLMSGVTNKAVAIMADYVKERVQFDRQIATFQAVAQRAADARINSNAIELTAWQAAVRLADGLDAGTHSATAKYWASEGGASVVRACTHLHGGVGVDRDYPLHRYYLWAKKQELQLGGTTPSLLHLGHLLADTPA
jgi:alkylation response protein AidB-like acyl-CoA dehydrogenase